MDINEALLEQSWLESNGIESFIPDELTASSVMPHVSVYSGIRLQVKVEDFEAAQDLLSKGGSDISESALFEEASEAPVEVPPTESKPPKDLLLFGVAAVIVLSAIVGWAVSMLP